MRVTSEFFIQALVRRVFASGGFAAVVRRGATEAGAIFILRRTRDGGEQLFAPAPQTGYGDGKPQQRRFILTPQNEVAAIAARLEREVRFDSDLWTVEIEDGTTPLIEMIEVLSP